ncbi:MAG: GlsB/YeaQ/YmgE family stress response membrane protein [Archangium sp.]|nr:GlsB/YeaQ/YmgE family stress response membrane protein [Archangium sp.]
MALLIFLAIGLVAGLVARALYPGNQSMGLFGTFVLGAIGSFIGGAVGSFFRADGNIMEFAPSGFIWSTLGAMLVLVISGLVQRGLSRRDRYRYR